MKIIKNQKGFSIIEVLVAFFILTVGILTIYGSTHLPLKYTGEARQKITAFYLAQEAIEIIRNIKENNSTFQGDHWLKGIPYSEDCFYIDYKNNSEGIDCNQKDQATLKFSKEKGYSYETGEETNFQRIIEVINQTDDNFYITSTVFWGDQEDEKIVVYKHFYNYMDIKNE